MSIYYLCIFMAIFSKVGKINTNRKKIDINLFVTLLIDLI